VGRRKRLGGERAIETALLARRPQRAAQRSAEAAERADPPARDFGGEPRRQSPGR